MRLFHFHEVVRFLKRPEYYYKSRQINAAIFSTFDSNISEYKKSLASFKKLCDTLWSRWDLPVSFKTSDNELAVEYLFNTEYGDRSESIVGRFNDSPTGQSNNPNFEGDESSSLAMGYPYRALSSFKVRFTDSEGIQRVPIFGTFAIGLQRCIYALVEKPRRGTGTEWPVVLRPFDVVILPLGSEINVKTTADDLYERLENLGIRVAIDDRKINLSLRFPLYDLFATPIRIVIGSKELVNNALECRYIYAPDRDQVPVRDIHSHVLKILSTGK
jgi:glycyl-tRNA synthetase (class II)